ncbi:hypothetical protein JCM6292_2022 [Bacteroides pyogenes JCM 6292]|uniref:Uncharacterized protein n=1 Tax=Bacteroides pyogenes JCM 6292 TaxID=1235809 RepID=W4P7K0_9BACE|nr:hypothetical protein JCM6292_2022 [Bacteroides pyogenes JCM 6292]
MHPLCFFFSFLNDNEGFCWNFLHFLEKKRGAFLYFFISLFLLSDIYGYYINFIYYV